MLCMLKDKPSSLRAAGVEYLLDSLLTTNREVQVCFTVVILTWSLFPVIKGLAQREFKEYIFWYN